ncbi:PREDICTED: putative syntaxin-24 [Camelina sativa]|uniref:Syntaxin-24 n=1 Tax=Camelina sativa TaxID=90675 RepID=A0ABM0X533_CAMSA|nr:PREDICTED: putative syntaxin-24 [Camelina sativa]
MADVSECTPVRCLCWPCKCVLNFFVSLLFFTCYASFFAWIMFISNDVKFQVYDAELTQFNLENKNNNLHYNLTLNLSIRNSKSSIGIHYDRFEAIVYYMNQRLGAVPMPSFYQEKKNTTVLKAVFEGQNLVLFDDEGRTKFEDDRKTGVYRIDVKMSIGCRIMVLRLVTWPMKPSVRCHLKVPLALGSSNSTEGFDFKSTKCRVGF